MKMEKEKPTRAPFCTLYKYATANDWFLMIVGVICCLIQGSMYPVMYYQVTLIIDSMDDSRDENGRFDETEYYNETVMVVYLMIAAGFLALFTAYLGAVCLSFVAINQANAFRKHYFASLLAKNSAWYDRQNINEVPIQLAQDCLKIEKATGDKLIVFINTIASIVVGLILAFNASAQLTFFGLLQFPIVFLGMVLVAYATVRTVVMMQQAYKEAGGIANECIENVKTVSANNMQDYCSQKYNEALSPTEQVQRTMGSLTGLGWGIVLMAWLTSSALMFWQGSIMMDHDTENWFGGNMLETCDIMLCIFVVGFSCQAVGFLVPGIQGVIEGQVACQRIINTMEEFDEIQMINASLDVRPDIEGEIEFRDVTFRYPSEPQHIVLDKINFKINKNETVAFVGETGCGKSTIISLIEKFYDNFDGEILIDGYDIRKIDKTYLREKLGLVSQEPILFNTTVYENIRYGKLDANYDEIMIAAEKANVDEFIETLPLKYETIVGSKGGKLSGGQKQRIAIARVHIREPLVMLLDEATSSLDKANEAQIMSTIWEQCGNKTTLIVAQRLSTVRDADRIFCMAAGKISEVGSHEELMERKGQYYSLVNRQEESEDAVTEKTKDTNGAKSSVSSDDTEITEAETDSSEASSDQQGLYSRILYMSRNQMHWILLAAGSAALAGSVLPVFGFLMAEELDAMLNDEGEEMKSRCARYALWMLILSFVIVLAFGATGLFQSIAGATFTSTMRQKSFKSILYHDNAFFDKQNKGQIASTLCDDSEKIHRLIGPLFSLTVLITTAIIVGLAIGYNNNWRVSLLVLCLVPFFAFGLMRRNSLNLSGFGKRTYDDNIANDSLHNIKTVRAYNLEGHLEKTYIEQHEEVQDESEPMIHENAFSYGMGLLLNYYVFATCFWFAAWEITENDADREKTNISLFAGLMCGFAINVASTFAPDVDDARQAAKRLFKIIDYRPTINARSKPSSDIVVKGDIKVNDVCFTYPSREVPVLYNISFKVSPGEFFSLTGYSGSGKSTIMQLLIRLYDPNSGQIIVDGKPIASYNVKQLRDKIVHVSQDTILFVGSIRENICLGKDIPEDEIWKAVEKSSSTEFVSQYGLDRSVGTSGSKLSGGQKQRLALARALLRNPDVLLLDESTSALDSQTEAKVFESLKELTPKKTVISIAHRVSSISASDTIAVMDSGSILEIGSPAELLEQKGHYYKLAMTGTKI